MSTQNLISLKERYNSEIRSRGVSKVAKPKRAGSERGTAWASFTNKVVKEHPEEFAAFKGAAQLKQGVAPKFVAEYRQKHPNEWNAYRAMYEKSTPGAEIAMRGGLRTRKLKRATRKGLTKKIKSSKH